MAKLPSLDVHVRDVACKLMQTLDTPISLGVYLRIKYECWDELSRMRTLPEQYLDSCLTIDRFRRDYQATSFLRKYPGLPLRRDLKKEAEVAFHESEVRCKRANWTLSLLQDPVGIPGVILELLHDVRKIVKEVLGTLPDQLNGRFGPGTVFEYTAEHGLPYRNPCGKIMSAIHCTPEAAHVVKHTTDNTWWERALRGGPLSHVQYVRGNRFTTVPKNATARRGICIEPGGNVFCQLGVGSVIRQRLLSRAGIDIKHGQSIHQSLACLGSHDGSLATIDLKSASDTISYEFVKLALGYCPEWFGLLDSLRSSATFIDGHWCWLQKFSSMGNGFTFELETLLFYAVALAASKRRVRDPLVKAYGDDLIVPSKDASSVISALKMFGFQINEQKTFVSGPFRESCGGDYFMGIRVTPMYLTVDPSSFKDWVTIANGLYSINGRYGLPACFIARSQVPLPHRYGPTELGNACFTERDPRRWSRIWIFDVRYIYAWRWVPRSIPLERYAPLVQLASALYGVPSTGPVPRNSPERLVDDWLAFS